MDKAEAKLDKAEAKLFLKDMQAFLNGHIPAPKEMATAVATSMASGLKYKSNPEAALLNDYITPNIHRFIMEKVGLTRKKARDSILSESFRNIPDWASASPTRSNGHPFKRNLGAKPSEIINTWKEGTTLPKSGPDIALRRPLPLSVVIEGKYFRSGGIKAAETALVKDLYQTFFYLGLPSIPKSKTHPAWAYDYGCLIAYDGSENGNLMAAWKSLEKRTRDAFWDGANIYVMILTGSKNYQR